MNKNKKKNIRRGVCKCCRNKQQAKWRAKNKESVKNYNLVYRYNIDISKYKELLEEQNNCCAICKGKKPLYKYFTVDHCHKSGHVRGLLCHKCNKGLGLFNDNIDILKASIEYLNKN